MVINGWNGCFQTAINWSVFVDFIADFQMELKSLYTNSCLYVSPGMIIGLGKFGCEYTNWEIEKKNSKR